MLTAPSQSHRPLMFTPMVTINDSQYRDDPPPATSHAKLVRGGGNTLFTAAFLAASVPPQLPSPVSSAVSSFISNEHADDSGELKLSDFLDIPSLVTDDEEEESEAESSAPSKSLGGFDVSIDAKPSTTAATQEVKRFIKKEVTQEEVTHEKSEKEKSEREESENETLHKEVLRLEMSETSSFSGISTNKSNTSGFSALSSDSTSLTIQAEESRVSPTQFNTERLRLMKIVVKYISMKITNSFPPESPRTMDPNEMPLETFLMILVSRLQLSLPMFMKGIIYLFRYMDVIYLLRYLNQLNNFANYTEMGFCIKKLIIGCFKLALARERVRKDWSGITGLKHLEINSIAKAVVNRLNGKLIIKNVELIRLKTEIFRFVKMVTKTV